MDEKSVLKVCDVVSAATDHKTTVNVVDWDEYFASLPEVDPFAFDTSRIYRDLSEHAPRLFQSHTDLEIFETSNGRIWRSWS